MTTFLRYSKEAKKKIYFLLGSYAVYGITLGLTYYPYIDDTQRQVEGNTSFGAHYARYGSELFSWIFQGSRHLTDTGLTSFLITSLILTLTSWVTIYSLKQGEKVTWVETIISLLIGVNPWFLACFSFRFDAPFMALSMLVSVIPFLFYKEKRVFYPLSFIAIFLMCNFYQLSSGIYIVMILSLSLKEFLDGKQLFDILKKLLVSAVAFSLGMILFF